ncbi:MAG: outer membrane protein assembly factor BamE [Methylobacter sp.]|uniref:outer membrane protein assembly factor BamE n=1 Tax=Methylobacter sp. TaxID=2051955 RepID=UPI00258EA3A0|nr:outer membrane protein assembly factor BamE [Methylobacter sp.]MCL7421833.1 outer membrane protein assembly factor BamE [Methylobacter sp.]
MGKPLFSLTLLVSLTLASCSTILNNLPGVYSIDIQQGNMIDQSMIDQIRPNMNKRQVLYIMGSPMLTDAFHPNRWDYLYSNQPGGEPRMQKKVSLFFDGDRVIGIQGDFKPSALPVIKESEETTVDLPLRDLEKTMWEKITSLFGIDDIDRSTESDRLTEPGPATSEPTINYPDDSMPR